MDRNQHCRCALLFEQLSPFKFRAITFLAYQLARDLAASVCKFLDRTPARDESWALETLDLSGNFFNRLERND
jgi:hypothetical protein